MAIYAALLSTIVFIWNFYRAMPRFKIELTFGIDNVDGEYVSGVHISVKNPSPHTVHISNISILYPYKKTNIFELITYALKYRRLPHSLGWVLSSLSNYGIDDGCPLALEPGKSHNLIFPGSILEKVLKDNGKKVIKVVVQDQLWRCKYSNKIEYQYPKISINES